MMKQILYFRVVVLATSLVIFCAPAFAATQGSISTTSSQGSATISVTKAVQARISDISDMTLSNWTIGDGAVTLYSNVCVYSSTQSYKVTASGSGASSAFTLGSAPNTIAYTVAWNSGGAGNLSSTGTSLTANAQSTNFSGASNSSSNCNGGGSNNDTARVIVEISQAAMEGVASSNTAYTGTLTMTIAPY